MHLTGGPEVSRGPAGHPRRTPHLTPHLEPDAGVASPRALPRDGGWADPSGAVGRGAPWVSPPGPRGDGHLSGEDGGRDPADCGAWGVRPTRADGPAAGAQPPEPPGPPDADAVERADHGALCTRRGGGHVSRPLSARRP